MFNDCNHDHLIKGKITVIQWSWNFKHKVLVSAILDLYLLSIGSVATFAVFSTLSGDTFLFYCFSFILHFIILLFFYCLVFYASVFIHVIFVSFLLCVWIINYFLKHFGLWAVVKGYVNKAQNMQVMNI